MKLSCTINGTPFSCKIAPGDILLDVLREHGFMSVKKGCGNGNCGVCTILLDGRAVNSCITFAAHAEGRTIRTAEGLAEGEDLHPLQQAFIDNGAVQCGFCTPGVLLSTVELLERSPEPTDEDIKEALDGNLCRCTGYVKIIDAIHDGAERIRKEGAHE